jgi:hypothetical protein
MTVFVYVTTSKQVGDPEHIKVFATRTPRKPGSRKTIPKALLSNMKCWPLSLRRDEMQDHRSRDAHSYGGHYTSELVRVNAQHEYR